MHNLEPQTSNLKPKSMSLEQKIMSELKEFLKSLVREIIEEDNVTSGGEAYSTPFAFSKKGQKTNVATKTAEKQGFNSLNKILDT